MTRAGGRATVVNVEGLKVLEQGNYRGLKLGLRSGLAQRPETVHKDGERWI